MKNLSLGFTQMLHTLGFRRICKQSLVVTGFSDYQTPQLHNSSVYFFNNGQSLNPVM